MNLSNLDFDKLRAAFAKSKNKNSVVFDLLKKPTLSRKEEAAVKKVAIELLAQLKAEDGGLTVRHDPRSLPRHLRDL